MEFDNFKTELFNNLKLNKTRDCLELIENNEELIKENLGDGGNIQTVRNFVEELNCNILESANSNNNSNSNFITIIVDDDESKYNIYEKVLKHPYFHKVYLEFKNSDILIKSCKFGYKMVAKWLMTLDINPYLQNEVGRTALMYAASNKFDFVITPYLHDSRCLNLEDKKGYNVLFHVIKHIKQSDKYELEDYISRLIIKSDIDINHPNHKGETAFVYSIKKELFFITNLILFNKRVDVNLCDNFGYTAAMYLTEKGYSDFFNYKTLNWNYDFINMENQSVMSILIDKLYITKDTIDSEYYKKYVSIMNDFINQHLDFNIPVDSDENTAFMVMIIVNDMTTAKFCAKQLKRLDLSMKNKYGESVTSLCYKLNHYDILPLFKKNPTYDYNYRDPLNQNTLLMISAINNVSTMVDLLENDPGIINEVNSKNENTLIIASKINNIKAVKELLERGIDINHQDNLGNTALHYAIEIQSPYLIHRLMSKNPDIHIKNNEGKSPLDLANEIDQDKDKLLDILMNPSCDIKKIKFENSVSSKYEEEIQSYIIPGANNHYPEFKSSGMTERVKKELYTDNNDRGYFKIIIDLFIVSIIIYIGIINDYI